jgi:hypothetical protein
VLNISFQQSSCVTVVMRPKPGQKVSGTRTPAALISLFERPLREAGRTWRFRNRRAANGAA